MGDGIPQLLPQRPCCVDSGRSWRESRAEGGHCPRASLEVAGPQIWMKKPIWLAQKSSHKN